MTHIAAIQTRYKGYLFRSRLEARWAVFFDRCREPFTYEEQGFSLPSGPYLPDFYLPRFRGFVEIKPASMLPTNNFEFGLSHWPVCDDFPLELNLIWELSKATGLAGVVAYGDPLDAGAGYEKTFTGGAVYTSNKGLICGSFCVCSIYKAPEAAIAAREARFEHGASR